ncbi:MAG: hypothetical protein PHN74_03375 [Candidatus Pacebacteria bacterium]|nr:hypothetical protein [Candidatus Paceibacterota bacterium]
MAEAVVAKGSTGLKTGGALPSTERPETKGGDEVGLLQDVKFFGVMYFFPSSHFKKLNLLETKCINARELANFLRTERNAKFFIVKPVFDKKDGYSKEIRRLMRDIPEDVVENVPGEYLVVFPAGAMVSNKLLQRDDLIKYLEDCFCGKDQDVAMFEKIVTVPHKDHLY